MIVTLPIGSCAVKVISDQVPGTWELVCQFEYGRGKLCNTYTRYHIRRYVEGDHIASRSLWNGWPTGAPDPMDPSERRRVYDWIEQATRSRTWLERKIKQLSAA